MAYRREEFDKAREEFYETVEKSIEEIGRIADKMKSVNEGHYGEHNKIFEEAAGEYVRITQNVAEKISKLLKVAEAYVKVKDSIPESEKIKEEEWWDIAYNLALCSWFTGERSSFANIVPREKYEMWKKKWEDKGLTFYDFRTFYNRVRGRTPKGFSDTYSKLRNGVGIWLQYAHEAGVNTLRKGILGRRDFYF